MSEPPPTRSRVRVLLAGSLVVVALLLAFKLRQGAASPDHTREAVRKVLDDQVEAWNQGDLDGFMVGYWQDEKLTFFSGADARAGWRETFDRYRLRYKAEGKEMGTLTFRDLDIDVLSPQAAIVRGRWQLTMKSGEEPGGLFTLVFKKMNQGWCVVHDHTSAK